MSRREEVKKYKSPPSHDYIRLFQHHPTSSSFSSHQTILQKSPIMQLTTVLLLTSSLATRVMGATDIMECHKPALLSNCKKVCDCPGDAWNGNVRPDCSLPNCTRAPLHLLHIPERARSGTIAARRNPSLSQSQRHTRTGSNTKEVERGSELVEHKKRFWRFEKWRLSIWGFVLVFLASKKG